MGQDGCLLPSLLLEGLDVGGKGLCESVVCHVEESETDLSYALVGCIEVSAADNAVDDAFGQWLLCLVVGSEGV